MEQGSNSDLRSLATVGQHGFCFEHRLRPGLRAYLLVYEVTLEGCNSPGPVLEALRTIRHRHSSLRLVFRHREGRFWLDPLANESLPEIPVADFSELNGAERQRQMDGFLEALTGAGFEPEVGPLARFGIIRSGTGQMRLLVAWHHAVTDGESLVILIQELEALLLGRPLPELAASFANFADWQAEQLAAARWTEAENYWKERFVPGPPPIHFPGVTLPVGEVPTEGEKLVAEVPPELVDRILHERTRLGVSTFRLMLAGFFVLAHRLTAGEDLAVGTTLRRRTFPGAGRLIGYFNNPAALRVQLRPGISFEETVRIVDAELRAAVQHQEYPFVRILQMSGATRGGGRPWPATFTKLPRWESREGAGVRLSVRRVWLGHAPHPLAFYCEPIGRNRISLRVEHQTAHCDSATAKRLLEQYLTLLDGLVRRPMEPITRAGLMLPSDRAILPDPRRPLQKPGYPTVVEAFAARVRQHPRSIALQQAGCEWSYKDLMTAAQSAARKLRDAEIGAGDTVAVFGDRSPGMIAALLGIWFRGGVLLLLDPRLPTPRLALMLRESGATGLIEIGRSLPEAAGAGIPGLRRVSIAGDLLVEPDYSDDPFTGEGNPDPAYVFFTSGTTGMPKAVLGSHRGLGHFLAWQRKEFRVGPGDRVAQLTGLSFDVVLRDMFLPLTSGATLCLPAIDSNLSPDHVLPWIQRKGITLLHTVPSLAALWVANPPANPRLGSLRCVFFAGEPLTDVLVKGWRDAFGAHMRVVNLYGPTETTLAKCSFTVPDPPLPGIQPVGSPQPETQILILGGERQLCGIGEPGEIAIRTPFRSLGYRNSPEGNAIRFIANPFTGEAADLVYLTGDRGRFGPDGLVEILGRMDFQIKVRGVRIEPGEVDATLARHPDVSASAVIPHRDEAGRYHLVAYYCLKPGAVAEVRDIKSFLREQLPETHVPESLNPIAQMPLTANGKLDRRALPAPNWAEPQPESGRPPGTPHELGIAEIWKRLLGHPNIDATTSFFDLGGHSLLALEMIGQIRRQFGREISLPILFREPTIAALAALLDPAAGGSEGSVPEGCQSLTAIQPNGSGVPLFVFPGGNGGDRELYVHAALSEGHLGPLQRVYALTARGHREGTSPHGDIRTMAADYVTEMRGVCRGPFLLLGDCTGGNIAFEVACQLQAAGEMVALLALSDCARPRTFEYSRYWLASRFHRFRISLAGRILFNVPRLLLLVTPSGRQFWSRKFGRLRHAVGPGSVAPESGGQDGGDRAPGEEYWTPLGERYRRTVTTFRPGKFSGRIELLLSATNAENPRMHAWSEHASEGLRVTTLEGDHWNYLWNNGPTVARLVRQAIERARRSG